MLYEKNLISQLQVAPTCDETLLYCKVMGITRECKEIFQLKKTPNGLCCTLDFNKIEIRYAQKINFWTEKVKMFVFPAMNWIATL